MSPGKPSYAVPTLVVMAGLSGAGKSTLALALGRALGWPVLDKDSIKAPLLELARTKASPVRPHTSCSTRWLEISWCVRAGPWSWTRRRALPA